jgi:GAF domain-containing protein
MGRYEPDGTVTVVGQRSGAGDDREVDARVPLGGWNVSTVMSETAGPTRIDDFAGASGALGEIGRTWGVRSGVGIPISVEGRLWGLMFVASTRDEPLPADTEERLAGFTELVATAVANAQARLELRGFAEEQAALRRVATLVAHGASPEDVFADVTEAVGMVLGADHTGMCRYEPDGAATILGTATTTDAAIPPSAIVGSRVGLGGRNVTTEVFQTGRPARIDRYVDVSGPFSDVANDASLRSVVGVPISVEGRLWGSTIVASTRDEPLPADTEERLAGFTELVATAIANAQARVEGSPKSRPRCGGSRRWSLGEHRRTRCSPRSPPRSAGCSAPTTRP